MKQLDPKAIWLFFISFILRWLYILIFLGFFIFALNQGVILPFKTKIIWLALPLFLIILFIWAKLSYHFCRYELADKGFKKELGVIYKKYVTIPYERIQNVDIYRGIWARILGLSDLHIQTAGMSSIGRYNQAGAFSEGRLPGLAKQEAERLREELINRVTQTKNNQGL